MKLKLREGSNTDTPTTLNKNTNGDKITAIREEIAYLFEINGFKEYAYYLDHDDSYIYFEMWTSGDQNYTFWKIAYTYDGIKVTVAGGEATQGVMQKQWKDFPEVELEKATLSYIDKAINKLLGKKELPIIKQFHDEEMVAIEPLYIKAGDTDLHGDTISLVELRKAVDSLNEAIEDDSLQSSLFHTHQTEGFSIVKSWINETECTIGGTEVPEGQPLAKVQFHNESLWKDRKSGELQGLSIGASGIKEDVL
jgi:hypothetical protein